jgi:RHS repeat-associated protein
VTVGGSSHTPAALSIAVTSNLRATVWAADTTFLPAPAWATVGKPVYATNSLPLEVRESLTNIGTLITSLAAGETRTTVSYDIPNLSLVGPDANNPDVASLFNSSFQAQPFAEPFTHKVYVRARWYDPQLGMWLTPDPAGYRDSSNLYAFAGGDPVNRRDPTGKCWDLTDAKCRQEWADTAKDFGSHTGHDLWNVASLGTLDRVQKQKNLGTLKGTLQSIGQGVTRISNAASLGLQDSIYDTQMREGAGVKSVLKGAGRGLVNITPYNEGKALLTNKNLTTEEKIRLGFTALSKTAALATLGTGRAAPVEVEATEVAAAAGGSRIVNLQPGDFAVDANTTALSQTRGVPTAQMSEISAVGPDDVLTLVGHGAPGSPLIAGIPPEELAATLQQNGLQAGEIELAVCYGACGAQSLADATGIPVRAADGYVNAVFPDWGVPNVIRIYEGGEPLMVSPEVGFQVFKPVGK